MPFRARRLLTRWFGFRGQVDPVGRGVGDCGVHQDYVWDGTRFRLVQQEEMSECRGSLDYITTWRAQVVGR